MTALEKILEKCTGKTEDFPFSNGEIEAGIEIENERLMPIIRELCAVIEEQQKALNKTLSSIGEVECNERTTREIEINYHVSDADYHARARLNRLADSESTKEK